MEMKDNLVDQDNQAAQRLGKNGKASSTKRTKHIEIQYFFVTDLIKHGLVTLVHCPTEEMVADYFTRPLQGQLFQVHRNTILGITMADFLKYQKAYVQPKAARASNL